MRPCDRLLHAVTMVHAGSNRYREISLDRRRLSLLHAKAIGTPLTRRDLRLPRFGTAQLGARALPSRTARGERPGSAGTKLEALYIYNLYLPSYINP